MDMQRHAKRCKGWVKRWRVREEMLPRKTKVREKTNDRSEDKPSVLYKTSLAEFKSDALNLNLK